MGASVCSPSDSEMYSGDSWVSRNPWINPSPGRNPVSNKRLAMPEDQYQMLSCDLHGCTVQTAVYPAHTLTYLSTNVPTHTCTQTHTPPHTTHRRF